MPKTRKNKCIFCGTWFMPVPQAKSRQKSCDAPQCKEKRKKYSQDKWRKTKYVYDKNEYHDKTKPWLEAHPHYLQEYRASHPGYVEKNRQQQKKRDQRRGNRNLDKRDLALLQDVSYQGDTYKLKNLDKRDLEIIYPELFLGLMSILRNLDKRDAIDTSLHGIYNRGRFLCNRYADM